MNLHEAWLSNGAEKEACTKCIVCTLNRTNTALVATVIGTESLKELLHFSLESLVSRYARTDSLTFMYYLKQGRPSFAFGTFIASPLKAGTKTIGAKL